MFCLETTFIQNGIPYDFYEDDSQQALIGNMNLKQYVFYLTMHLKTFVRKANDHLKKVAHNLSKNNY